MKALLLIAALVGSASAFARPNTTKMTCAEVQRLVQAKGSIVLGTGPYTYELYYSSGNRVAYAPTLDNAYCHIGYLRASHDEGTNPHYPEKHYGRSCKTEGVTQFLSGPDKDDAFAPLVTRTCINGQWVVSGVRKPVYRGCKEGTRSYLGTGKWNGDNEEMVPAVCRNGKFVEVEY